MSQNNEEHNAPSVTRRHFLQTSLVGAGGLFAISSLSGLISGCNGGGTSEPEVSEGEIHAWIHIQPDNTTQIIIGFSEMGQGVYTALPMLIAEELNADWSTVEVVSGPANANFDNNVYHTQVTAGSTSVISSWTTYRQAGADVRHMLRQAAATRFNVSIDQCVAENSVVTVRGTDQSATYGDLASEAAQLPIPSDVPLKPPSAWTIIGQPLPRVDIPAKVRGAAEFGIDVDVEGMLYATVMHCPVLGGTVGSIDAVSAMAVAGVQDVINVGNAAVVVADGYWPAFEGARALYMKSGVTWDYGPNVDLYSSTIHETLQGGLGDLGIPVFRKGHPELETIFEGLAGRVVEGVYEMPYLAHAALEPMNATVAIGDDGVDIWVPTQVQADAQSEVAKLLNVPPEQVRVHTTFLGGGFGRRLNIDFILQAAKTAQAMGKPVKLIWSREEDTRHDFYRPAVAARIRAGYDTEGNLVAWEHKLVVPPFVPTWLPLEGTSKEVSDSLVGKIEGGINSLEEAIERDVVAVFIACEGAVEEETGQGTGHSTKTTLVGLPYNITNESVTYVPKHIDVPIGFWRAVGPGYNVFFIETMIDEVAHATGQDPIAFRKRLLTGQARYLEVLNQVEQRSNWGSPSPGRFQGVAFFRGFGSVGAQVAEIFIDGDKLRVEKVTCVVDCGPVINPNIARQQIEGAIVFGLTAALYGKITIDGGMVLEGNFDNYRLLPFHEMPEVDVHFIRNENVDQIGGLGEVGTPLIAPAVANAIRTALGVSVRTLPFRVGQLELT